MCLFLFRSVFKECFWWVSAKQTQLSQSGGCNSLAYSMSAKIKWKNGIMRMDVVIFLIDFVKNCLYAHLQVVKV